MCSNPSQTPDDSITSEPTTDRRSILTRTAAAAAAGSLGGCLSILSSNDSTDTGGSNGGSETGTATPTGPTAPAWTEWAYPQGFVGPGEYDLRLWDTDRIRENSDRIMDGITRTAPRRLETVQLYLEEITSVEDVEYVVQLDDSFVYNGSWDKRAAEEEISAFLNVSEVGERDGYTIFDDEGDDPKAMAVTDDQLVVGRLTTETNDLDSMGLLERMLDAKLDARERYADTSVDFRTSMDGATVDSAFYHQCLFYAERESTDLDFGKIRGATMDRTSLALEDGTLTGTLVFGFASEDDLRVNTVEEYAESILTWTDMETTELSSQVVRLDATIDLDA